MNGPSFCHERRPSLRVGRRCSLASGAKSVVSLALMLAVSSALAQPGEDERPPDIEVGSRRIGGPGTATEQAEVARAYAEEDEEVLTEETLPPKGNKKRLPGLHQIAKRYVGGADWITACDRYDQLIDEGGDEALDLVDDGKKNAAKAYQHCAEAEIIKANDEKAERLIKKSEKYGGTSPRLDALRRRMARERYRREMMQGNVDRAFDNYKKYQAQNKDEDERIWMGTELTKLAVDANKAKDKVRTEQMIKMAEEVSPQNPELRALIKKLDAEKNVFKNALTFSVAMLAVVGVFGGLAKLRSRSKIKVSKFEE
ncbi:MAG: hypothetical protein HY791_21115 [Deltaproteobacteria bacterium]|nr:hypothetical protein [Deltaproteobacteria bacterium]